MGKGKRLRRSFLQGSALGARKLRLVISDLEMDAVAAVRAVVLAHEIDARRVVPARVDYCKAVTRAAADVAVVSCP